uniref:Uncharacterized protein n=1 Tax=Panagrolaimus sp. JU765 TaxID=591449 RepID=A0AC34Q376_9BILA
MPRFLGIIFHVICLEIVIAQRMVCRIEPKVEIKTRMVNPSSKDGINNSHQLSAESGGLRCLKSVHGTYLRAYDNEWKVDMTSGPAKESEKWYVEDWHGKVVFKAIYSPGRFLRAHPDGRVDLVDRPISWETWIPFKNNDGSWSFLSVHGQWLSAHEDGSVSTVEDCDADEHFWLEWWK